MPNFTSQDWFHAISTRRHDVISVHLKDCAGKRNTFGETGLMCAVRQGDAEGVRILAPKECGILSQTSHTTALMMACEADNAGLVEILAPFEHKDTMPDGKTAFMVAAHVGATNCINIMLKYGTREQDQNNRNALDYAILSCKQGIVVSLAFSGVFKPDDIRQAMYTAGECKNTFAPKLLNLALQYITGQETVIPDLTFEVESLNKEIASLRTCLHEVMGESRDYYLDTYNGRPEPSNLLISRFVDHMHRVQGQLEELSAVTAAAQAGTTSKAKTPTKKNKPNVYELEEENAKLRIKAASLEYIVRSPIFKSHTGYNLTSEDICDRINAEMMERDAYVKELERQIKDMRAERQREMNQVSSLVGLKDDYEKALEKLQETQNLLNNRTDQLKTYRTYMGERSGHMAQLDPDPIFRQRTMKTLPGTERNLSAPRSGPDFTERGRTLTSHRSKSSQNRSVDSTRMDFNDSRMYDSSLADQCNTVREVTTVTTTTKTYSPAQRPSGTTRDMPERSASYTTHSNTKLNRGRDRDREPDRDRSLTTSFGLNNSMRNMQAMSDLSASRRRHLRPAIDPTPNGSYHSFNCVKSPNDDRSRPSDYGSYVSTNDSVHHSEHRNLYSSAAGADNSYASRAAVDSPRDYGHRAGYTKDVPRESTFRGAYPGSNPRYETNTARGTENIGIHRSPETNDVSHLDPPSLLTSTSFADRNQSGQPYSRRDKPYSDPIYSAITDRNNSSLDRNNPWSANKDSKPWEDQHPRIL